MLVEDGTGGGFKAGVTTLNRLKTEALTETLAANASRESGRCYAIVAEDAGPVAAEYPLYILNTSDERNFVIDTIRTAQVDADVIWKLHHVTGTAAGGSVITASNLNLGSDLVAPLTCRGGAGGVTGLTSVKLIDSWMGGYVYNTTTIDTMSAILMAQNDAIAIEYDAGTGGACVVTVIGHFYPW
jgi:hypothetical protein